MNPFSIKRTIITALPPALLLGASLYLLAQPASALPCRICVVDNGNPMCKDSQAGQTYCVPVLAMHNCSYDPPTPCNGC